MRLLQCYGTGKFRFTKDYANTEAIPPYAILSHTWEEDQEISFEDIVEGTGKFKTGYRKIRFCAQQAKRDGLAYFWIDTCCIKQSNKVELQIAINSMFRWYQNAAKCYVYLSDVSKQGEEPWGPAFEHSRLGDKQSLQTKLCKYTGIPQAALQGAPLSEFSNEDRFLWMQYCRTQLEEDKAYALLGIFGVEMPLRYGEGSARAYARLEKEIEKLNVCLRDLRISDPRDDKKSIQETKGGLLRDSYHWILETPEFQQWRDDEDSRLLWIKGDAGKGKTMLLCGLIDELNRPVVKTTLLSYFFCQATNSGRNKATAVLRGLLYLLVKEQPLLASHILQKHAEAGKALFEDSNSWVALSDIFVDILRDPGLKDTFLVVDALDECQQDLQPLLEFISQNSGISARVRWIVSSRNLPRIERELDKADHKVRLRLELNQDSVAQAVDAYIGHKVDILERDKQYDAATKLAVEEYLKANAGGTFLWVALVYQDLANPQVEKWHTLSRLKSLPPGLDPFYSRMLKQIYDSLDADVCKEILALASIVLRPVSLRHLRVLSWSLAQYDLDDLQKLVKLCGSFLTLKDDYVSFIHQSAKDYLVEKAHDKIFPEGVERVHRIVYERSFKAMADAIPQDCFNRSNPGGRIAPNDMPDAETMAAIGYSCVYWVDHLEKANTTGSMSDEEDLQGGGVVPLFILHHGINWNEALVMLRDLSANVNAMDKLENLAESAGERQLIEVLQGTRRLCLLNDLPMDPDRTVSILYMSSLSFGPPITEIFTDKGEPVWGIMETRRAAWYRCLQSPNRHTEYVRAVAFSPDGTRIAAADHDIIIRIWDAATSTLQHILEGHTDLILQVIFSPDGRTIASNSDDNTIRLWDVATGELLHVLEGHESSVFFTAFSPDGKTVASGSLSGSIRLWDAATGVFRRKLKGHTDSVSHVIYSPDGTMIASASYDKTVRIWHAATETHQQTFPARGHIVRAVSFSSESDTIMTVVFNRMYKWQMMPD